MLQYVPAGYFDEAPQFPRSETELNPGSPLGKLRRDVDEAHRVASAWNAKRRDYEDRLRNAKYVVEHARRDPEQVDRADGAGAAFEITTFEGWLADNAERIDNLNGEERRISTKWYDAWQQYVALLDKIDARGATLSERNLARRAVGFAEELDSENVAASARRRTQRGDEPEMTVRTLSGNTGSFPVEGGRVKSNLRR
jgi:hypothetical protein